MKLYNTQSRKVEEFVPHDGNTVRMYVCGPNLYAPCHVGHAMSYIIFDVLRRYLEYRGYQVRHVQNFTDIEDNIILRAQKEHTTIEALAERHIHQFFLDMDALNVQRAEAYPRASQEIPAIIEIIQQLIAKGHAYQAEGDIYFRVRSKPDYGKLSGRDVDSLRTGTRIEPGEHKEDPADFALWKVAKPGEPSWDSPWGKGRPGWHIECSAMSQRYLGNTIDIHGGGQDLVFPHHENEIAQSESALDVQPYVRFWVHNGLLRLSDDEEKMTRHLGNLIPIDEVLQRFGRDALRLFILGSNYRSPLTYSLEILAGAQRGAQRLRTAARQISGTAQPAVDPALYKQRFLDTLDDDFNTAGALAALFDLTREINRAHDEGRDTSAATETLRELGRTVLGLTFEERQADLAAAPFIELLIQVREQLRSRKLYDIADDLRGQLTELGVTLEDSVEGTRWLYGEHR